jgi:hypothetical protein
MIFAFRDKKLPDWMMNKLILKTVIAAFVDLNGLTDLNFLCLQLI